MLNANQVYFQTEQSISKASDLSLAGLSKLTLFEPITSEPVSLKDDQILSWMRSSGGGFYICKGEFEDMRRWDVFAEGFQLAKLLEKAVVASNIDYILWPSNTVTPPKLLVFDMDSTFIQIEVIDELARRHGVGDSVSQVTEAAMRGELDFSQSLISRVACLENLSESTINDICVDLPLSPGVERLVKGAAANQVKVVIVSGGFTPFVEYLKQQMNIYQVKANHLGVKNGLLTGKLQGSIVDAQAKADFVNRLKIKLDLSENEIMAIGDGANDLLMMRETGFSLAYRAKPTVQKQAKGRMNQTTLNHLIEVFDW